MASSDQKSSYRHDLSTVERKKLSLPISTDVQVRVRKYALRTKGLSVNLFLAQALERQVLDWNLAEIEGQDPTTEQVFLKVAGQNFPQKPEGLDFPRGYDHDSPRPETVRTTVRTDPSLLEDWSGGVWYQLQQYTYPAYAFEEAVKNLLEKVGA